MVENDENDSAPRSFASDHNTKPSFRYQPMYAVMKDKKKGRTNTACGPWTSHHIIFETQLPGEKSTSRWRIEYRMHTHDENQEDHLDDFFDFVKERVAYAVCTDDQEARLFGLCDDLRAWMVRIDPHNGFAVFDVPEGKIEICTDVSLIRMRIQEKDDGGNDLIVRKTTSAPSMVDEKPFDATTGEDIEEPEVVECMHLLSLKELDIIHPAEFFGEEREAFGIPYSGLYYYPFDESYV
ncbi:hypothetical protein B2J93_7131 [Marssonina coronariae]|uniref:Uncharacterized protein n=1 Tax=Diplocarpon coronariae TaxID=2795749 RepID=A0A218YU22_9HELO|nr:hypothetical protein B2J93_7131 [Marssonina coronariae]